MSAAAELRRAKLRYLREETFDLLVIGGGINGAGIAREAALRGIRTALVDKGDFASGTSSRSSKLIHGGFRYLETRDFGLVLAASRERDLLRRRLAPHLVRPLRFFFPMYRGGALRPWKLRAGLLLYDVLSAFRNIERHRGVPGAQAAAIEPRLRSEGLCGGALYYDCLTDDSRLVLETVLSAEEAGATCLNYVCVEALEKDGGRLGGALLRDLDDEGGSFRVCARSIVNAAGPWLDRIRALDDPAAPPVLRLTKGVHLVLPRERVGNRNAIVLNAVRDGRILFVLPWEEQTLVGTTDTDFDGSPDRLTVEPRDLAYLLETLDFYFPQARLDERDVVASFAGLRPLVDGSVGEAPSEVSREEALFESASGLISLGGGKLTTYRRVAVKVVDAVARRLRREHGIDVKRHSGTDRRPLPGAVSPVIEASSGDLAAHLRARYGSRAGAVLAIVDAEAALAAPLSPGAPDAQAEASFAARTELAVRIEDVLRRRTGVALRNADGGAGAVQTTAALMASELGWSKVVEERRAREYVERLGSAAGEQRRRA